MYIKSITIDGFKSYGQRITINQFDPFFNAITGLNGSGKSNILDSICFVLGISNLSQVRAGSLTELIYKNGQAGITKASVSVTFDNNEKAQCPVGYEQYEEITVTRQIVIGGQNKYLINGSVATNSRVKDLFQSVQLNVNNPHFLIMQGRITKVLNMKPLEILSMIEEAAGTKMYETKKLATEKTIAQKDAKLREIDAILDEDINPTLTKLKDERQAYLEYQNIGRELQHLTKLVVAYQYVCAEECCDKTNSDLEEANEKTRTLQNACRELDAKIKQLQKDVEALNAKRAGESEGQLDELEKGLKDKDKAIAKISSNLKNLRDNLKAEQKKKKSLGDQLNEDKLAAAKKEDAIQAFHDGLAKLREASSKDAEAVTAAENHFQAVSSGLSSNADGQAATFADQLIVAKTEIARSETETKQAEMTLKHSRSELKSKETELKVTEQQYKKDQATLDPLKKAIERIEAEMKASGYQEGRAESLTEKRRVLQRQVTDMSDRLESMVSRAPHSNFVYDNPAPNFDRRKVKGLISDLFDLRDASMATALEVTAGGKLFNVVVDNEETGKLILNRGNLKRRHTIVPLNKIQGHPVSQDVLRRAESVVGKGNVFTALSLVDYDPSVRKAMEYAFGGVLVCRNMDQASAVAFHPDVMKRTVTVDGESYDPAGTLTGGSRRAGPSTLAMIAEIKTIRNELNEKREELKQVESELSVIGQTSDRFANLKQQLDLKQRECELLNQRVKQTTHYQRLEEVNGLRQTIVDQETTLKRCQEAQDKESAKVKELELKIKDSKGARERELKAAEKNVATCKRNAEKSNRLLKEEEQAEELIRLEFEDLRKGLANYDKQMEATAKAISELETQMREQEEAMVGAKAEADATRAAVTEQKNLLKAQDQEISELQKAESGAKKQINSNRITLKELELTMSKLTATAKETASKMTELRGEYDWIDKDKEFFGKAGSRYDFAANDPKESQQRLHKLQSKRNELSKNVNMRAMTMLDKTEEQYNDLIRKKEIVEKDKVTIAAVIKELDEKKKEALQTAWVKVNTDFGSIFSTLLPGTNAKLIPVEGKSVLEGLEVKVAFGNKWKESLNELSGGQRSLVALSLILALLLFKPAPIYILDEVDAALDLSHTQNIGNMLKSHFKHSQFIIVSLKDGMFNNANVLFKTKFVDGMSAVTRHAQNQTRRAN